MSVKWTGGWQRAKEDIIAWKMVERWHDGFMSMFFPDQRAPQFDGSDPETKVPHTINLNRGELKEYHLGKTYRRGGKFGYYMYEEMSEWFVEKNWHKTSARQLKVRIPKGTMIRRGFEGGNLFTDGVPTINAKRFEVLECV